MKVPILCLFRPYYLRIFAFISLIIATSLAAEPFTIPNAPAANNNATATSSPGTKQLWNLQNADINAVIEAVSKETGKNFIIDPRVQGKITIVSSEPIGGNEVYQVFLSALQVLGYAAIPTGDMIKIVPDVNAKALATPIITNGDSGNSDQLVVQILPLKNTAAMQMLPAIQPLLPENSGVSVYQPANALILSGRAANISRVVQIAESLDQSSSSQTQIYPLRYANATKVVSLLNTLQNSDRATGKVSMVSFAADEQSNSILMSGPINEQVQMLKLINKLDTPPANETGGTQVIALNYLKAEKLAPILAKISNSTYLGVISAGNNENSSSPNAPRSSDISSSNTGMSSSTASSASGDSEGSNSKVSIAAEPNTNSVIISAPASTMTALKTVINELDVKPAQVLVEAVIATVGGNLINQLGVEWSFNNSSNSSSSNSDNSNNQPQQFTTGQGIIQSGNLQTIIHALEQSTSSDILATPSIMVMNNQKASILDGQNVSFQNSSQPQSGNNTGPYNTFDRKDVGLTLKVTPQISPNNTVQLEIEQDNNSFGIPASSITTTSPYSTSKISTTVMVGSGDILVLGGLINQDTEIGNSKVPLLGDIPIAGKLLFSYKNKSVIKKELMIFIRPIITNNSGTAYDLSSLRYNFIRDEQLQRQRGQELITEKNQTPLLNPSFAPKVNLPSPFTNNGKQ